MELLKLSMNMKNKKNNQLLKVPDVILTSGAKLADMFNEDYKGELVQIANYANGGFYLDTAGTRTKKYWFADVRFENGKALVVADSGNDVKPPFLHQNGIALDDVIDFLALQKVSFQSFLDKRYLELAVHEPIILMPYNASEYLHVMNYFEMSRCGVQLKNIMLDTVMEYLNQ